MKKSKKIDIKEQEPEVIENGKDKRLLDFDDGTVILMNPVKNRAITMTIKGLEALCELKSNVHVFGDTRKSKRVNVRMSLYVYPKVKTDSYKLENFWMQDLQEIADDLSIKNFHDYIQPITTREYERSIKKWNIMDFIEKSMRFSDKDNGHTLDIIWNLLEKSVAEKSGINKNKLIEMSNSIKKEKKSASRR
jgi:hypothetical protein